MNLFPEMMISATGLSAERMRMELIAHNIANINTTKTADGGVFRRKMLEVMAVDDGGGESGLKGVEMTGVVEDTTPPQMVYEPENPDAGSDGFVAKPNVNLMMEMVDLLGASRAYEANVTLVQNAKDMARQALTI